MVKIIFAFIGIHDNHKLKQLAQPMATYIIYHKMNSKSLNGLEPFKNVSI